MPHDGASTTTSRMWSRQTWALAVNHIRRHCFVAGGATQSEEWIA
jgi:hypothetical protein